MRIRTLTLALTLALSACGAPPETPSPSAILSAAAAEGGVPIIHHRPIASATTPIAPLLSEAPAYQPPRVPTPAVEASSLDPGMPSLDPIVDARTPDALVASLQAIEQQVSPRQLEALKGSLTVFNLRAAMRYKEMALRNPTGVKFKDDELFKIAFGDIHGLTVSQVIASANEVLPTIVDEQGNLK